MSWNDVIANSLKGGKLLAPYKEMFTEAVSELDGAKRSPAWQCPIEIGKRIGHNMGGGRDNLYLTGTGNQVAARGQRYAFSG
jgi:hypothetical protein